MYSLKNKCYLILMTILIFRVNILSQEFEKSPIIETPGINNNYDILPPEPYSISDTGYICWENHVDSNSTIYLQKILPDSSEPIIIFSSKSESCNPTIAIRSNEGIFVIWQSIINNNWQLLGRTYYNGKLSEINQITNSGYNNISPSLSNVRLVWIANGNLLTIPTDSLNKEPFILDSINCSNPIIYKYSSKNSANILYEKGDSLSKQIFNATQSIIYPSYQIIWEINKISNGLNNLNPKFGIEGNFSFQTQSNGFWKICYSFWSNSLIYSISYNSNRENPDIFTYPIPTKKSYDSTPFYIAFDSDSLKDNKEIYIKTILSSENDSIINISAMPGNDTHPSFMKFFRENRQYLAVVWEHEGNKSTSSIWWAFTEFHPVIGAVQTNPSPNRFHLSQNYPNPFNPSTTIEYYISNQLPLLGKERAGVRSNVTLKVYDILGREVATLVNKKQNPGNYKATFNGANLPSGIYYYRLKTGKNIQVKKMILLK